MSEEFPREGNLLRDAIVRLDKFGMEYLSDNGSHALFKLLVYGELANEKMVKDFADLVRRSIVKTENVRRGLTRYDILSLLRPEAPEIQIKESVSKSKKKKRFLII